MADHDGKSLFELCQNVSYLRRKSHQTALKVFLFLSLDFDENWPKPDEYPSLH